MASEHEYTIRIKKEFSDNGNNTNTGGTTSPEQKPSVVDTVKGTNQKSSTASTGLKVMALSVGKSYIKYGLSNVGKWTGSSRTQNVVNGAMEIGDAAVMAAMNPYVAAAAIAVRVGTTWMDGKFDNYMQGLKSTRSLQRAGYSSIDEVIGVKH